MQGKSLKRTRHWKEKKRSGTVINGRTNLGVSDLSDREGSLFRKKRPGKGKKDWRRKKPLQKRKGMTLDSQNGVTAYRIKGKTTILEKSLFGRKGEKVILVKR